MGLLAAPIDAMGCNWSETHRTFGRMAGAACQQEALATFFFFTKTIRRRTLVQSTF